MRTCAAARVRGLLSCGAALTLMLSLGLPARVYAQVVGATLSGTITDPSGAVIPSAQVAIRNSATGVVRTVTTNADGVYVAPNLQPGDYEVTASAPGFNAESTKLTLTVGENQALNLTMKVGQATQTVQVTGAAPAVNLVNSEIGGVNNETQVRELPLNGRSWTDLATLQAGVVAIHTQFTTPHDLWSRGFGGQLTISGARPQQNNYRLDGISINDPTNGAPGSLLGGNFGVDAVQEFSVLTTNYSTEYGRASGGIINATTKAGTNQFHGDAYEFLRNYAMDAANFWDNYGGLPKTQLRRNQFGASAGGPIKKDKTFIFGDYEGLRQSQPQSQSSIVPSANARLGILNDYIDPSTGKTFAPLPVGAPCANPNATNLAPGQANICVDNFTEKFVNTFYPRSGIPNGSDLDTAQFPIARPTITGENYFIVRADHNFSDRNMIHGTYFYDFSHQSQLDEMGNLTRNDKIDRNFASIEETHTFSPALVNSVRAGYHRSFLGGPTGATAVNPATADPSFGFVPGLSAGAVYAGTLQIFYGGLAGEAPQINAWNSWQLYDDAFWTKGKHSIKFGGNVERIDANMLASPRPGGQFNFGSIAAFLSNGFAPSSGSNNISSDLPGLNPSQDYRQDIFGLYIQDDFRFRPNLTFNIGLRYEPASVPTLKYGRFDTLLTVNDAFPHVGNVALAEAAPYNCPPGQCLALGRGLYNNNMMRDFDPRVGFAWDPFHTGKTSVRGGFGLYDQLLMISQMRSAQAGNYPFTAEGNANKLDLAGGRAGAFPTGWLNYVQNNPDGKRAGVIQQNPGRAYVMQWNLSIERQITPNLTALVGYVGSHGVHGVTYDDDVNMVSPTPSPLGYLWPCEAPGLPYVPGTFGSSGCFGGGGTAASPFLEFNQHVARLNAGLFRNSSRYDGLQLQLTKRVSHGLQFQGSFAWQKGLDTASASAASDQFLTSISSLPVFDPRLTRGPSEFNIGKVFSFNALWNVPAVHSLTGLAGGFLSGWQLGAIFSASDGAPFTPVLAFDDPLGQLSTDPWDFPNRVAGCNPINSNYKQQNLQYVNLSCFTVPSVVLYQGKHWVPMGSGGRNTITGPGLQDLDFSLVKNTYVKRISESFNVQFRAEFFNILNHANFNPIGENSTYGQILDGLSTGAIGGAGQLNSADGTATDPREIQLALKIIW
jgi:Carboxypeptidase regulatory-like domain/TonB-dependent Receptor Plug Domain